MARLNCSHVERTNSDNHKGNTFIDLKKPLIRESPSGCGDIWRMIEKIIFWATLEHAMTLGLAEQSAKYRGVWQLFVWWPENGWGVVICQLRPLESTALATVWSLTKTQGSPWRLQGFLGFSVVPPSPVIGDQDQQLGWSEPVVCTYWAFGDSCRCWWWQGLNAAKGMGARPSSTGRGQVQVHWQSKGPWLSVCIRGYWVMPCSKNTNKC